MIGSARETEYASLYRSWGYILERLGKNKEAERKYRLAIRYNKEDPKSYYLLAENLRYNYNIGSAIINYQHAIAINNDTLSHVGLGLCFRELNQDSAALVEFGIASKLSPKSNYARLQIADMAKFKNNVAKAQKVYQQCIDDNPNDALPYLDLALLLQDEKNKTLLDTIYANELVDLAVMRNADPAGVLATYGAELYKKGLYEKSLAIFDKSLLLDNSSAFVYYYQGLAYSKLGIRENEIHKTFVDKAEKAFNKAIKLLPHNSGFYVAWSDHYFKQSEAKGLKIPERSKLRVEARKKIEDARVLDPYNIVAYTNQLIIKSKVPKLNKQVMSELHEIYKSGNSINPGYAPLESKYGTQLEKFGDFKSALSHYEKARKIAPRNAIYYINIISIFERQKRYQDALKYVKLGLQELPNNKDILSAKRWVNESMLTEQTKLKRASKKLKRV